MKRVFLLGVLLCSVSPSMAHAAQWTRHGKMTEKEWTPGQKKPATKAYLTSPPSNSDNCSNGDLALNFNISELAEIVGLDFDVDKLYFDGISGIGEEALDRWKDTWFLNTGSRNIPPLNGYNWGNQNVVSFCVGTLAQSLTADRLESVIMWYDAPIGAKGLPYPLKKPLGTPMYLDDINDIVSVSGRGKTIRSLNGYGGSTEATDPPDNDHPDFIVDKVWLTTTGGTEQYTYNITDEIKMNGRLKNIGDDDIPSTDHVESRFYLSRGYKEDAHSEWIRVGTDETLGNNLDEGESHSEQEGLKLWEYSEIKAGKTYNIVVCADRTADSGNGDGDWQEEHESNNCSTEAVFTVNGAFNFNVTSVALSTGSANLTPGQAFNITTVAYNAGIDAPVGTRVGYYFSGGSITGDLLVGTSQIKEENFEASTSKNEGLTNVIAPTDAGTYTLKVCTDYDDRVVETNETDNCTTTNFVVAVPLSPSSAPKKTTPSVLQVLFGS